MKKYFKIIGLVFASLLIIINSVIGILLYNKVKKIEDLENKINIQAEEIENLQSNSGVDLSDIEYKIDDLESRVSELESEIEDIGRYSHYHY